MAHLIIILLKKEISKETKHVHGYQEISYPFQGALDCVIYWSDSDEIKATDNINDVFVIY